MFGFKTRIHAAFLDFGTFDPPKGKQCQRDPKRYRKSLSTVIASRTLLIWLGNLERFHWSIFQVKYVEKCSIHDMIWWTILTCAQKLTRSQLSLPHGTKPKRIMKKLKTYKKPSYRWGTARRGRASWNLVKFCTNVDDLYLKSSETRLLPIRL